VRAQTIISRLFLAATMLATTAACLADTCEKPLASELFSIELSACRDAQAEGKPDKCKLFGRIEYVDAFPDVRVQVVDAFPDIRVQVVDAFPDGPGRWQIVDSFPDYRVQKVDAFPDYRIEFVDAFPGCD